MQAHIKLIEEIWENHNAAFDKKQVEEIKSTLFHIMTELDKGNISVVSKNAGAWHTNTWLKKAILLSFKFSVNKMINADSEWRFFDKIPLKFASNDLEQFASRSQRVVPGSVVRYSAYIGRNVILMPSFVNVGAYIDDGTLIDTWSTIGSCAYIGKNCHISGGVGIGGVLEPVQQQPVIIEDNVFIGARSEIAEGVIVEQGSVLSMGVFIGASTRIYDRATDKVLYGRVPAFSVVVPGTLPSSDGKTHTYAAIIVKQVDAATRAKTQLNELLRQE